METWAALQPPQHPWSLPISNVYLQKRQRNRTWEKSVACSLKSCRLPPSHSFLQLIWISTERNPDALERGEPHVTRMKLGAPVWLLTYWGSVICAGKLYNFRRPDLVLILRLYKNTHIKDWTAILPLSQHSGICIIHISDTLYSWRVFILRLVGFTFCIKNKLFTWKLGTKVKASFRLTAMILILFVGDNGPGDGSLECGNGAGML